MGQSYNLLIKHSHFSFVGAFEYHYIMCIFTHPSFQPHYSKVILSVGVVYRLVLVGINTSINTHIKGPTRLVQSDTIPALYQDQPWPKVISVGSSCLPALYQPKISLGVNNTRPTLVRASPAVLSMLPCINVFPIQVLVIYCFATPPIKLKLGQQVRGGLLIANHMDQSLWWANKKHWSAVRSIY
jgi:hypothetical protein